MTKNFCILILFLLLGSSSFAQKLAPTDKLALLTGSVSNFKGKALSKETILFVNQETHAVTTINTDAGGKFEVLVPTNATYVLKYKTFTSDQEYTKMTVPADKEASYEVKICIDPPQEYVLENVYFDSGKATLKPSSNKALNDLAEVLKLKTTMVIEIQGHTDDVGDAEENLKLSQQRAEAVKKFVVNKGIDASRIKAKGFGQTQPVADNSNTAGKAKNRRTSLKVIKE